MDGIKFVFGGENTALQRNSVPMLTQCFEEWQMFQAQYGNNFPFREISFAALDGANVVGHVGIMPFSVSDANGGEITMAGIASVGTHPDYRYRGIAANLCDKAAEWAVENGFDCLPLYTSFHHVYESCSWNIYPVKSVMLSNRRCIPSKGKKGYELTADERDFIIDCYSKIPDFCGKVLRTFDKSFHGWDRIFRETFFDWYVNKNGYSAVFEDTLAEFYTSNGDVSGLCSGAEYAFLPPDAVSTELLCDSNWTLEKSDDVPECWHGENVMIRSISEIPDNIFFSLVDKF